MASPILITILALIVSATSEPLILETYPAYTPAAYISPAPIAYTAYPPVQYQAVQALPAAVPYAQASSYSYGSQVNEYLYRPAALTAAYTVPYAYASDYYYRQ